MFQRIFFVLISILRLCFIKLPTFILQSIKWFEDIFILRVIWDEVRTGTTLITLFQEIRMIHPDRRNWLYRVIFIFEEQLFKDPLYPAHYRGEIKNGLPHGRGTLAYNHQIHIYQGDFKDGMKHGNGIQKNNDYSRYEREYRNNKPQGKGKRTDANKDQYVGDYYENKKQGKGVMKYKGTTDGSGVYKDVRQYSGDFYNHCRHGGGKISFKDGSSYEGQFKNDHIHGYVAYKNNCNEIVGLYTGDVLKDEFAGRGRMIYTNKSEFKTVNYWKLTLEYHGMFKNNMRHGLGKMISSNFFSKSILEGYWENDVMIKEFKGVEIELNENLNDLSCRICLENVSKFEMFAPCNCKGSQK